MGRYNEDNSDGHLNRIGGKHNRFPTRKKNNYTYGRPIGAFNAVAKGTAIFLCAAFIYTVTPQVFSMLTDSLDIFDTVQDVKNVVSKTNKGTNNTISENTNRTSIFDIGAEIFKKQMRITNVCDLSETDIDNILGYLQEGLANENIDMNDNEEIILMKNTDISDMQGFDKNVLKELKKYNLKVTFCFYGQLETKMEREAEIERIRKLLFDSSEEIGKLGYIRAISNVLTDFTSDKTEFVYFITFMKA